MPVDQNGNALRNAFSWLDRRAQEEAEKIEADFGAEGIFDLAGKPAAAAYTLPKLMWMKKHERKLYDRKMCRRDSFKPCARGKTYAGGKHFAGQGCGFCVSG